MYYGAWRGLERCYCTRISRSHRASFPTQEHRVELLSVELLVVELLVVELLRQHSLVGR